MSIDNLQIIQAPNGEEMVVLRRKDYEHLVQLAYDEDAHDAALAKAQLAKLKSGKATPIPEIVVRAMVLDNVHPLRAWRDYRGWTAEKLAKKAKIARPTLTQMETRKRKGTMAAYRALATALGIGIEALID